MATAAAPSNILKPGDPGWKLREHATHRGQRRAQTRRAFAGALANATPSGKSLDESKVEAAYVGYHKTFNDRLKNAAGIARRVATVVQTDDLLDVQVWLSKTPNMRRWMGDKVLNKFRFESMNVRTYPHEASVEVPKKSIMNDKLGMYAPKISKMADAYERALNNYTAAFLAAGVAGTALGTTYDGQNLIDTDHTVSASGGTAQSNKVTGAFSETTYNTAWNRFIGMVDENGDPLNPPDQEMILLHGPANRQLVRDVLDQEIQATGETNMDRGTAIPVCTGWLAGRTIVINGVSVTITGLEWFLLPANSSAVLIHEKQQPEFMSVEDGEFVFRTGDYLYGIEAEFGAAYGLWQEVVGGPGS